MKLIAGYTYNVRYHGKIITWQYLSTVIHLPPISKVTGHPMWNKTTSYVGRNLGTGQTITLKSTRKIVS